MSVVCPSSNSLSPPMPLPRMHAAAERIFACEVDAAVVDGLGGGDHGELGEAVEPADGPGVEHRLGIETPSPRRRS